MAKSGVIINTINQDLEKYRKDTVKKIITLVAEIISAIEVAAYRDLNLGSQDRENMARAGVDSLNFIQIDKKFSNGGLTGEVGVMGENDLAAYFEFGTGLSAQEILAPYPQEIKDIAMKFYVNGQGTLQGKPYLYNNYLRYKNDFLKELEEILSKETRS